MTMERVGGGWGARITIEGKGRLRVKKGEVEILLTEIAAPRGKALGKEKEQKHFPVNAIDSLMPILRKPYLDFGVDSDESYWFELESSAGFSPETACAKLRSAGFNHEEVAEALMARDRSLQVAIAFGQINETQVLALKSLVADEVLKYYNPKATSLK